MKISRRLAAHILVLALLAVVIATVAEVTARSLPEWTAWFVLTGVIVVLVGAVHALFYKARVGWARKVVEALGRLIEGDTRWDREPPSFSEFGENLRVTIDELRSSLVVLRQEKRRAETILAGMADGIIAVDCDENVTLFNRAASCILDRNESAILGKKLEDADLHPELARLVHECVTTRADQSTEIQLPGQPSRAVDIRVTALREKGREAECAIVILHDLTEIRRHEKTQKEFVSNVSHELRTPLTAIRTTAEALLSGAKHDEALEERFLSTIVAECDRLSVLVDDLMEIARVDSGITRTEKSDVNLAEIINRIVGIVSPAAEQKQIAIEVNVPPDFVCYCDGMRMGQVIRNLLDNAVKYTPEGGRVSVEAHENETGVTIVVKDTGIGIPQGEVERIFERFYRVDKSRSVRLGGTGLGLAIVKDIVQAHGGKITVETQLGQGSSFAVTLPSRDQGTA